MERGGGKGTKRAGPLCLYSYRVPEFFLSFIHNAATKNSIFLRVYHFILFCEHLGKSMAELVVVICIHKIPARALSLFPKWVGLSLSIRRKKGDFPPLLSVYKGNRSKKNSLRTVQGRL